MSCSLKLHSTEDTVTATFDHSQPFDIHNNPFKVVKLKLNVLLRYTYRFFINSNVCIQNDCLQANHEKPEHLWYRSEWHSSADNSELLVLGQRKKQSIRPFEGNQRKNKDRKIRFHKKQKVLRNRKLSITIRVRSIKYFFWSLFFSAVKHGQPNKRT